MTTPVERMKHYASLKVKEAQLKAELDLYKEQVLTDVLEFQTTNGNLPTIEGVGTFTVQKKKEWVYTPSYENAKLALDDLKAEEQALGTATFTEKEILVFKQAS